MQRYRFLDFITASFVGVLILSNIGAAKIVDFSPFVLDGATVFFPLTYIFCDILTEVYGYKRSRRVLWTGFFWSVMFAILVTVFHALPSEPQWNDIGIDGFTRNDAFGMILGQTPRIVIASILAYLVGEFANSFVLAKMKILTKGRFLWTRTIGSTIVGQAFDTTMFVLLAFWIVLPIPGYGPETALPLDVVLPLLASSYVFKVGVEVLFTPITYKAVNFLKRVEKEDYYDYNTNFTPFSLEVD